MTKHPLILGILALFTTFCSQQGVSPATQEMIDIVPKITLARDLSLRDVDHGLALVSAHGKAKTDTFHLVYISSRSTLEGTIRLPNTATRWDITIQIRNIHNRIIGMGSDSITGINLQTGKFEMRSPISVTSAMPRLTFSAKPDTVSIKDRITLAATATDTFNGTIQGYSFSINDTLWFSRSISSASVVADTFIPAPSDSGIMIFVFKAVDDEGNEETLRDTILVRLYKPVALLAVNDSIIGLNDSIYLSASNSYDINSDGAIVSYFWKFGDLPWQQGSADTAILAPAQPDSAYICSLRVIDDDDLAQHASVAIRIVAGPPSAIAGIDTTVGVGDTIILDARGSTDADGTIIRYQWKCGDGTWTDTDTLSVFMAPLTAQLITCSLCVTDDDSLKDYAFKTVSVELRPPVAVAGNDTVVGVNDRIILSATGSFDSNSNGRIVTYGWLWGADWVYTSSQDTFFQAPATPQTLSCSLIVIDDDGISAIAVKTITVELRPPVANAGNDTTMGINDTILLNASLSHDSNADGTITAYAWKFGSGGWFSTLKSDTFIIAPAIPGTVICSLMITDDDGVNAYDQKTIVIETRPPSANAGSDTIVTTSSAIILLGSGIDETRLDSFEWKIGVGSWTTSIDGSANFLAPSTPGTVVCSLRVTDDDGNRAYDAVKVTVIRTRTLGMARIAPFDNLLLMDKTEVTQRDYLELLGQNPSFHGGLDNPVEFMTIGDAILYCNARSKADNLDTVYSFSGQFEGTPGNQWTLYIFSLDTTKVGYRLPTDLEWEYASKALSTTTYSWGNELDTNYVWYRGNSNYITNPVASKLPNGFGLYDMSGNVGELVTSKHIRGGAYTSAAEDVISTARSVNPLGAPTPTVGFRCVIRTTRKTIR